MKKHLSFKQRYFFFGVSLGASGIGTGTGSGVGTGAEAAGLVKAGLLCFSTICACLCPSPYMVMTIIKRMSVMDEISHRDGFSIKNNAHFGLNIPTAKNNNVKIPRLIAWSTMSFPEKT
jgi:hypothetical protein